LILTLLVIIFSSPLCDIFVNDYCPGQISRKLMTHAYINVFI